MSHRLITATLLLVGSGAAFATGAPFYGYAYDLASGKYLYTEIHEPKIENGKEVSSTQTYYSPDGVLLGRKTLDYRNDPFVPLYRLDLSKEGYSEGVSANGDRIEMFKVDGKGKAEKRKSIKKEAGMAADSGFDHIIQAQLPTLLAGKPVSFRFAVAGELDSFRFRITKVGEGSFEGKPAVKLLVQADSLLRYIAPDLSLLYDADNKRLLEYRGVSNIHDPATGEAYNTRIVYFSKPPPDAPKLPPLPAS